MAHPDKEILDIALDLFSQKGYSSVSTRELAQAAGVTEMTLFRKFQTKRNLFVRIAKDVGDNDATASTIRSLVCTNPELGIQTLVDVLAQSFKRFSKMNKIIITSPEIMDLKFKTSHVEKLQLLHEEAKHYLFRTFGGKNEDDHDLLAMQIIAQVLGCFVLDEVVGLPFDYQKVLMSFPGH